MHTGFFELLKVTILSEWKKDILPAVQIRYEQKKLPANGGEFQIILVGKPKRRVALFFARPQTSSLRLRSCYRTH